MAAKKKPAKRATVRKSPPIYREPEPLRLDLGSGPRPAEGFKGVDVVPGQTDFTFDLCNGAPWPFGSNSVDELRSSHFIEHVDALYVTQWAPAKGMCAPVPSVKVDGLLWEPTRRRIDALLFFFDEAFRVAKDGAVFTVIWPALQSVRAFQDPTHRRFIPAETIGYLSREGRKAMGVEHYGATCNWIGQLTFSMPGPTPEEQKEAEAMALRADSSDEKIAWHLKKQAEHGRRYQQTWGYAQDFIATLRAQKS